MSEPATKMARLGGGSSGGGSNGGGSSGDVDVKESTRDGSTHQTSGASRSLAIVIEEGAEAAGVAGAVAPDVVMVDEEEEGDGEDGEGAAEVSVTKVQAPSVVLRRNSSSGGASSSQQQQQKKQQQEEEEESEDPSKKGLRVTAEVFIPLAPLVEERPDTLPKVESGERTSRSKVPWKTRKYSTNRVLALHEEMEEFVSFISPSPTETRMREDLIARITSVVTSLWPKAVVKVLGSFRTGLFLPSSDVDIVVLGNWAALPLKTLGRALEDAKIPSTMKIIDKARVPIIKFRDSVTSIDVDISFNQPHGPIDAEKMIEYMQEYPSIRPLVLVLKQFLAQRGMNEVFSGGLGSYSIFLMVMSFLQLHPRSMPSPNLGVLLMEFFELYGRHFNYAAVGICVRDGGSYFPKEEMRMQSFNPDLLCIENPTDTDLDVSGGSYNMPLIKESFANAHAVLSAAFSARKEATPPNYYKYNTLLGLIIEVDEEILDYRDWVAANFGGKASKRKRASTPPLPEPSSSKSAAASSSTTSSSRSHSTTTTTTTTTTSTTSTTTSTTTSSSSAPINISSSSSTATTPAPTPAPVVQRNGVVLTPIVFSNPSSNAALVSFSSTPIPAIGSSSSDKEKKKRKRKNKKGNKE